MPPIDWGRHLVGHPVPERDSTQGRTRYCEPNMAHPPPSATPDNTKEWEPETWVARMASLSNFRHHVLGDIPPPDDRQPAPSTYMTLMYNLRYTLSTTHYHAPTEHWVVHGTDSLLPAGYAPPPHIPGLDPYARGDEPDDPHIWGTWERKSLDTLLSIRSGSQGLGRAIYCPAKWTQLTWGIPTDRWLWMVTLRPSRGKPPQTAGDPPPHAPPPYSSAHTWWQPASWRCCGPAQTPPPKTTPTSLRRTCPASSDASSAPSTTSSKLTRTSWSRYCHPPRNPRARTAETTLPHHHQHARVTRENTRTRPVPEPAPSFSLLAGPSILRPPPKLRGLRRLPQPSPPPPTPQPPHHDHLIHHHHHVLIQHSTPQAAGDTPKRAPKPVPTASNPAAAKVHAPTRPAPVTQPKPKTATKQPPKLISAPRPQPAAKPKPKPKLGAPTAARARPPEDVLYDIRPQPSQARRQQHPARRPATVSNAAATTFIAERAAAEARRTSSRHLSKPAPQAHRPPPIRPERRQGPPAASPPPYQPSMTAHIPRMPRYRRRRESPPNPQAETVRAHPRVHIRSRPHSPRTPTVQD